MEHPGAAGSGEVKTCRGEDVVAAGAGAILNELGGGVWGGIFLLFVYSLFMMRIFNISLINAGY